MKKEILVCKIKKESLDFLLNAAKKTYPDEFIAVLEGTKENDYVLIDAVTVPPFSEGDEDESSFSDGFLPPMPRFIGVFHSHPNSTNEPSDADLETFSKGLVHLIARDPFVFKNVAAYNNDGTKVHLEITK